MKAQPHIYAGMNLHATRKNTETIDVLFEIVGDYYGISKIDLKSKKRNTEIVKARQMFCHLAKVFTNFTLQNIGYQINRDHATVLHSIRTVKNEAKLYKRERELKEGLERKAKIIVRVLGTQYEPIRDRHTIGHYYNDPNGLTAYLERLNIVS